MISFSFYLKEGPGVDIYIDYVNLDPTQDYLLIVPGDNPDDPDEKSTIIMGQQKNLTFKIIHTNKVYIKFFFIANETFPNRSFKLSVSSHGEFPSTTTPPSTTAPSYIGKMKTITKSLIVPKEFHNDTNIWDQTLRNALVSSTNLWRKEKNFTDFLEECTREDVVFERITPCPLSWPDNENCVRLEFGVPLNKSDYDGELDDRLNPDYELTEEHLEEMWHEFGVKKLEDIGMPEYFLPNQTYVLLIWVSVSVVIVILFCFVLYGIWKSDLFKDYRR